jgi:hypothetical protein
MIAHVLLIKPKATTDSSVWESLFNRLRELPAVIPDIKSVQVGKNVSVLPQGYTYGLVMHFEDADGLKAYINHPAHDAIAKDLVAECEDRIELDLA